MADEATNVTTEEQTTEKEPHGTDWKAEARKWEQRAKENRDAAAELEKIKRDQMSELEKAQADAAVARAEAEALKVEKAKSDAVIKANSETGVPVDLLAFCADPEQVGAFAKALQEWAASAEKAATVHSGTSVSKSRIIHAGDAPKVANRDVFASLFNNQ